LVILFGQAEAAWLELVAELTGCTEKEAQRFLQMPAAEAKRKIVPLAQTSGIIGFALKELSEGRRQLLLRPRASAPPCSWWMVCQHASNPRRPDDSRTATEERCSLGLGRAKTRACVAISFAVPRLQTSVLLRHVWRAPTERLFLGRIIRYRQRAMRADDFDIPAGQPFREVRDFLRRGAARNIWFLLCAL